MYCILMEIEYFIHRTVFLKFVSINYFMLVTYTYKPHASINLLYILSNILKFISISFVSNSDLF